MNKILRHAISLASLAAISVPASAAVNPQGQSILCQQRGWLTEIAISTPDFVVAVCSDETNINDLEPGPTHYIGQSKSTGEKIVLPLTVADNSFGPVPNFYKAVNGRYTYQMYISKGEKYIPECQCQGTGIKTITLSVFDNGNRIYKYETNRYLSGWK